MGGLDNALKLATVEDGATAVQTASEIKTAYEANANTNPLTDTNDDILADIGEDAVWTTPTLLGTWVEYSTSWGTPGYYKDPSGTVYLRGMVSGGTLGTDLFVLPVGFRPKGRKIIMTSATNVAGRLDITNDGQVRPQAIGAGTVTWFSISCCFKAEL